MQVTGNSNMLAARPIAPRTLKTGVRFGTAMPGKDSFQKSIPPALTTPAITTLTDQSKPSAANTLKALLKDAVFADRKQNAAHFLEQVSGIKPRALNLLKNVIGTAELSESRKDELRQLADQVKAMTPVQKVDMVKQVTGPESPYSKVVEAALIHNQRPALRDIGNMFKPDLQGQGLNGIGPAIGALGMGLLLMPVVAPAALFFSPQILGGLMANAALLLI